MDQLKIAIFGSSGAIGSALCRKYIQQENVEKVFCFSRQITEVKHEKAHCFILDYLDEENLSTITREIYYFNFNWGTFKSREIHKRPKRRKI